MNLTAADIKTSGGTEYTKVKLHYKFINVLCKSIAYKSVKALKLKPKKSGNVQDFELMSKLRSQRDN